ncbi:MAG: nuclear transport factor 2 family protein [Hyphomicrobiaceae bacterium]
MVPSAEERDALFKTFGRAWFKRDVALLYEAVTPDFVWAQSDGSGKVAHITGRDAVGAALTATGTDGVQRRFEDVAYHHAGDQSFMTFRIVETIAATGETRADIGVERYRFRDGRIALKDVYRKRAL